MKLDAAITVDHITNAYTCYSGEPVILSTRVTAHERLAGYKLEVILPAGLELKGYQVLGEQQDRALPAISPHNGGWRVFWDLHHEVSPGQQDEYQVQTVVTEHVRPAILESTAQVTPLFFEESRRAGDPASETLSMLVKIGGRYLRYLPSVYESDDFMGRFLMLFESFWGPIERQVDLLSYYFDPFTTPMDLLPWLATWVNLLLDERWPEEKQRRLLKAAVSLYRMRGTRRGMEAYLEIYTGVKPRIVEHRAENFQLGAGTRLGLGIALGTNNVPHTFSITVQAPPLDLTGDEETDRRLEQERRRVIESIIHAEKPAHTAYTLELETLEFKTSPSESRGESL